MTVFYKNGYFSGKSQFYRIIAAILVLTAMLGLIGCAKQQEPQDTQGTTKPAEVNYPIIELKNGTMEYYVAIGFGAEDGQGLGNVSIEQGMASKYQPIRKVLSSEEIVTDTGDKIILGSKKQYPSYLYKFEVNPYLQVGFVYREVNPEEYQKILAWQEETGIQVIYPMVDFNRTNKRGELYCIDPYDANMWYKANKKGYPVYVDEKGNDVVTFFYDGEGFKLEDNYLRDTDGNVLYYLLVNGGDVETGKMQIRVLYHNYFIYLNGVEPVYPEIYENDIYYRGE